MKRLKFFFLITDFGFIAYWFITAIHLVPDVYLYSDYHNPLLVAWNWSFLPLDLCVSATGLTSVYLYQKGNKLWQPIALISLVLTLCSGLQALAFWSIRTDINLSWWLPNAYLLVYPLFFIPSLLRRAALLYI